MFVAGPNRHVRSQIKITFDSDRESGCHEIVATSISGREGGEKEAKSAKSAVAGPFGAGAAW